jgi:hypothetical protein
VNQVMGDGIMALFGAPLAHEDHAVRACFAALAMQEQVKKHADGMRRQHGVTVGIRVGLNSGEVVVRTIGSDLRMDYSAVGQTTHLAARMEQLAEPGTAMLTADTLALAEGYIEVRPLGPTPVKGLADPIEIFAMVGASAVRSRFQAATARGLSKFVGRTSEIEQLSHALEQAKIGRGQLIAVVGEPGVGKSRLYYEFTRSHRVEGCVVIESSSVSYGKASAYLPVIDLLRTYFRIEARDDPRSIREKVTGRLFSLDRALEPFLPALLWVLDVTVDDPAWERLDPPQRRRLTLDGVKRLLLRESQVQPVVVVFEDLHWIDTETQALVDALVESLPTSRIVMLVNYRPEYQHGWGSKSYYHQLRIDALPAASAHELLDAMLGADPTVQPLKSLLVRRTEGTPFFLEESVRTLVETRVLAGDRGAYRLTRPVDAIQVPATVKALLAARIDRLTPEDKMVLQAASVVGTDVPLALLEAIADLPHDELRRRLEGLQAAEFLYETNLFPEVEYTFKHALTHEVAYGSLLGERRRTLHARIVEAIERRHADRLGEHVERLAYHALRGEIWEQAARYLYEAGVKASRRSANAEAVTYLNQALEVVPRLPASPDRPRQELQLLLALGPALQSSRGFGATEVERTYARARQLGEELGAPIETYQAMWGLWLHKLGGRGRQGEGVVLAQGLVALAERLGERTLLLEAHHAMSPSTLWFGDPLLSRHHCEQGIAIYDREQDRALAFLYGGHDAGVCCRMHLGLAMWILGYPAAARARCHEGLALGREIAHPGSVANAFPLLCLVEQLRGDRDALRAANESTVAVATEYGYPQWVAFAGVMDRWVEATERADATATTQMALALEHYRATNELYAPFFQGLLGAAHLKHGRIAEGMEVVEQALAIPEANRPRVWDAELLRLKGEMLLVDRRTDAAEAAFRQALAVARSQQTKSWELRTAVSLSRLWQRHGNREEAARLLADVYGWFTEGFETGDLLEARALAEELAPDSRR